MAANRTNGEVAEIIHDFLTGTGSPWDWDDFISASLGDPRLDNIRQQCANLPDRFPPGDQGGYCGEDGLQELREILTSLRQVSP